MLISTAASVVRALGPPGPVITGVRALWPVDPGPRSIVPAAGATGWWGRVGGSRSVGRRRTERTALVVPAPGRVGSATGPGAGDAPLWTVVPVSSRRPRLVTRASWPTVRRSAWLPTVAPVRTAPAVAGTAARLPRCSCSASRRRGTSAAGSASSRRTGGRGVGFTTRPRRTLRSAIGGFAHDSNFRRWCGMLPTWRTKQLSGATKIGGPAE
jgi:hypothetical protein